MKLMTWIKFSYIDIMRDYLWPFYHRYILHFGIRKYFLIGCDHGPNPYNKLTPLYFHRLCKSCWPKSDSIL